MEQTERILEYLTGKYRPLALVVCGSFAAGTNGPDSDFDALVIAPGPRRHDDALVDGTALDVWVCPPETFQADWDPAELAQLADGRVVLDPSGLGAAVVERVRAWQAALPRKSREELRQEAAWCRRMLARALAGGPEGDFRRHWLLTDSLEIFCDLLGEPYRGPKKALALMEERYGLAALLYRQALAEPAPAALKDWVKYLSALAEQLESEI